MMTFKEITSEDTEAFDLVAAWSNDPAIEHLVKVSFKPEPYLQYTAKGLQDSFSKQEHKKSYLVLWNQEPIGEVSIDMNPPHLAKHDGATGWLGIMIASPDHRGKGLGQKIIAFAEQVALEAGMKRMELGVFAYNERAIKLYSKAGYQHFHTFEKFTYYDGDWYDDYRMEKTLDA